MRHNCYVPFAFGSGHQARFARMRRAADAAQVSSRAAGKRNPMLTSGQDAAQSSPCSPFGLRVAPGCLRRFAVACGHPGPALRVGFLHAQVGTRNRSPASGGAEQGTGGRFLPEPLCKPARWPRSGLPVLAGSFGGKSLPSLLGAFFGLLDGMLRYRPRREAAGEGGSLLSVGDWALWKSADHLVGRLNFGGDGEVEVVHSQVLSL